MNVLVRLLWKLQWDLAATDSPKSKGLEETKEKKKRKERKKTAATLACEGIEYKNIVGKNKIHYFPI